MSSLQPTTAPAPQQQKKTQKGKCRIAAVRCWAVQERDASGLQMSSRKCASSARSTLLASPRFFSCQLHHGTAAVVLLRRIWVFAFVNLHIHQHELCFFCSQSTTHCSPSRWYHPVLGLLVCECNQAVRMRGQTNIQKGYLQSKEPTLMLPRIRVSCDDRDPRADAD